MDDQRHDVFICFRGDEPFGTSTIRRAIVEPLFDSLTGIGASVFMDDESIENGQPIPDTILQGILRTRGGGAALILVSPDFFSRVWPLIEMACFHQAQHYPDQDQIHLFIVCLNVTPEYIKQAAFVKQKCPGVKKVKFVVAPTHIRYNESRQVVGWLSETIVIWIKSNCVALGRTRTNSFHYFKTSLLHLPNQAEIGESLATYAKLNELLVSNQPLKLSKVFAAAALENQLSEDNVLALSLVLSALKRDGQFLDTVNTAIKYLNQYNKKWLNRPTIEQCPDLSQQKQQVEKWFYARALVAQRPERRQNQRPSPRWRIVRIACDGKTQDQLCKLSYSSKKLSNMKGGSLVPTSAAFLSKKNRLRSRGVLGTGSLYLSFSENHNLNLTASNQNIVVVSTDEGVEFEVDATNTWSWPLTLDEHGVLNDAVRNNLALLIASFDLEGICKFRVHQILSSEENDHYAVFFMPSDRDIQTSRSIVAQEGFMEKFEQAYNTFDTTAKDQVAFCGGCGVVQRTSPDNPYLCRLGHLQAVHILDQPIPQEKAIKTGFEWMPHNLDRRVDLLISCEQDDKIVSSLKDYFSHDTYSIITSENRDMSSFLQAVLSTRGGGIALVLMTKNYMIQSRTISELACLYEVRQDIRLIIACVGTTKSQVLQNVIIQELRLDLSSHLFLECDSDDSVDSLLKNQISQELLQHVIPGFRRDQSYLVLKDRLVECFANSPGPVFAKIAINLDLESISVMNWSDLLKQAELHGKFGEEQMGQLRQAILTLPDTEFNSNHRTAALKIIQRYENKWLADWTSKKVPALDKIGERAHLEKTNFENSKNTSRLRAPLHKTLNVHTDTVSSVAFSPDNKLLASASWDYIVRLWSVPNGELNAEFKGHEHFVLSVAFSPDSKSIVTGSADKTVQTWSVATKQQVRTLKGHTNYVRSVAWSPNGDVIASSSLDTTVILWDAISGLLKKKLTGHRDSIMSVSFSHNGNKLASAGYEDNTAIIWDVYSGAALIKLAHSFHVWSVCFSHDDRFVVTGCSDGIVRMFDVNAGREVRRFVGHANAVRSVAISFDGSMIASGSVDKSVRLWDVASAKQFQQLDGHTNQVNSVAFSRDGKFIASGSDDKTVLLWNASQAAAELDKQKKELLAKQQQFEMQKIAAELEKQKQEQLAKKEKELLAKQAEIEKQQKIALEMEKKQQELKKKEEELLAKQQEIADRERKQREESEKQKKQEEEAKKIKANLDPTKVAEWSVDDVCGYFKQAKIDDDVIDLFRSEKIKGKVLADHAKDEVLQSMGIKARGDRAEVIQVINKLLVSPSSSGANTGLKLHEIPRRELTKDTQLSEGKFGIVWRGKYNGIPVAIKQPKLYGDPDLIPSKQLADLVEEATVMTSISAHPNVLHCYGISRVGEDDYLLATELCNLGSLESFLQKNSKTSAIVRRRFSQQVARGLNHLGKHNVAHGDVAARNVLLHDQGGVIVAKVCNFGLSRQREGEYYKLTGQHLLSPETAPEVFNTGKHSSRSDVWSFGVLLWEVESLCATRARPDTQAFPPFPKPGQGSDNMYGIMLKCWAKDPHQRPSFEALVDLLA